MKRCFTLVACPYEKHCELAHIPTNQTNQWFQPPHVGEFCDHYKPLPVEIDHHDEISRMMGALS